MNYENFALFLKTHVGGDDNLLINLAWPYNIYFVTSRLALALARPKNVFIPTINPFGTKEILLNRIYSYGLTD